MSAQRYHIVYEQGAHNWSAYVEDLPGLCVATGATREECERNIEEAIAFHLDGLSPQEREQLAQQEQQATQSSQA